MTTQKTNSGFTLLEVLIALGIMAFGIATVLGIFTMGTTTHKRAIDRVNASLLAESVIDDIRYALTYHFDHTDLPVSSVNPQSRIVVTGVTDPSYPGFRYTVILTPQQQSQRPTSFFVEVEIKWSEKGREKTSTYATILLRRIDPRDIPIETQ